ncbi:MAG: DUF5050 domain-containing protein [Clostridiales bacterium]|nr:DUF5050 domain-containing protein [Clostridiales bacterium]
MDSKEIDAVIEEAGAIVGIKNEWVYYETQNEICKFHLDGSNRVSIYESANGIQSAMLDGDWIYIVTNWQDSRRGALQKVRLDGTGLLHFEDIADAKPFGWADMEIRVHDDWVYYSLEVKPGNLYRVSSNGNANEVFIEGHITNVAFADDWIFFEDITIEEPWIYMMKLDKTQKKKLYRLDLVC